MRRIRLFLALTVLLGSFPATGLDVEKLVMPGSVIRGHADVEGDCARCHVRFRSEAQNGLCMECHTAVASDIETGSGYHGLAPSVSTARCSSCHTDHEGRDADVVSLDPEVFDHDLTDYRLVDAHRNARCEQCHASGVKFRDAARGCIDCHAGVDAHAGRLGERCADCHTERTWRETRFDHARTRFPLVGRHRDAGCALCHPADCYEDAPLACQSCHGLDDVHLGRFGSDCERCHSAEGWRRTRFDHDRDTRFPLNGAHRGAACEACHGVGNREPKPASDCISCHRADDEHRGRFGAVCEQCHGESSWKSTIFDHDRSTDFPLRGAHRNADCRSCHTEALQDERIAKTCIGCHGGDDVHKGQEGRECGRCHSESGWTIRVFFDHDLTRFPLLGLHAVSACEQCHLSPRFKEVDVACSSCHQEDDIHRGGLGSACEACHNPNGWRRWRFDHDTQTDFALGGAHGGLDCRSCHRLPPGSAGHLGLDCAGCHARDDIHYGAFGRDCDRCHGDESWREVRLVR